MSKNNNSNPILGVGVSKLQYIKYLHLLENLLSTTIYFQSSKRHKELLDKEYLDDISKKSINKLFNFLYEILGIRLMTKINLQEIYYINYYFLDKTKRTKLLEKKTYFPRYADVYQFKYRLENLLIERNPEQLKDIEVNNNLVKLENFRASDKQLLKVNRDEPKFYQYEVLLRELRASLIVVNFMPFKSAKYDEVTNELREDIIFPKLDRLLSYLNIDKNKAFWPLIYNVEFLLKIIRNHYSLLQTDDLFDLEEVTEKDLPKLIYRNTRSLEKMLFNTFVLLSDNNYINIYESMDFQELELFTPSEFDSLLIHLKNNYELNSAFHEKELLLSSCIKNNLFEEWAERQYEHGMAKVFERERERLVSTRAANDISHIKIKYKNRDQIWIYKSKLWCLDERHHWRDVTAFKK